MATEREGGKVGWLGSVYILYTYIYERWRPNPMTFLAKPIMNVIVGEGNTNYTSK